MTETNFKHTDLGLIPHDWEVKTLAELCEFRNGYTPSKAVREYWENGTIPWFRMEDIRTNGRILSDAIQHITPQAVKGGGLFEANSIIMSTTATIGEHARLIADSLANQQFTNLKIRKSQETNLSIDFFFYYCFILGNWCRENINEGGLAAVNMQDFANVLIPLPPTIAEQERIAGALSGIDTLIGALTEQIEKKRHIKQGTMQQLLTGKKRLAGFTGEWVEVTFEDVFSTISTRGKQLSTSEYDSYGIYPIVDQGQQVIVGYTNKRNPIKCPQKGAIIFGDHTRCFKYVNENFFVGADGTQVLMTKEDFVTKFIYYLCLMLEIPNTGYNRHFKYLKESIFTIPPTIAEQSAIAAVLSRMDTEIAALEQKRDKYIAIKSGMMQNLLTGKIRI